MLKSAPLLMLTTASLLGGCAFLNDTSISYSRNTTIGQELMDLEEARGKGILSDSEYIKLKEDIMQGGPVPIKDQNKN